MQRTDDGFEAAQHHHAHFALFAFRPELREQGGQQSECAEERDKHAAAGDDAELGHAHEVGGGEGEEAAGGCQRGNQDLRAGGAARLAQRLDQFGVRVAALAEAHGELDGEIDRDADEEDGEGDRDQVQRADGDGRETGGEQQAEHQGQRDGHHQAPRADGGEQPDEHEDEAAAQPDGGTLGNGGEFLVVERHAAGLAHACLAGHDVGQACCGLAHGAAAVAARLQIGVVQHRLGGDEAEAAGLFGERSGEQVFPRERLGVAVGSLGQGGVELCHRRPQRAGVDAALCALGHQ